MDKGDFIRRMLEEDNVEMVLLVDTCHEQTKTLGIQDIFNMIGFTQVLIRRFKIINTKWFYKMAIEICKSLTNVKRNSKTLSLEDLNK